MVVRRFVTLVALVVGMVVCGCLVGCSGNDTGTSTDSNKPSPSASGDQRPGNPPPNNDGVPSRSSPSPSDPPKTTKKQNGGQCKESADCQSDFCVFQGSGLGMCTTTCDSNIDCDLGYDCVKVSNAPQKVCVPG